MTDNHPENADWQGVGASFRALGRRLKERAVDAGGAVSAATDQAAGGVLDQMGAAFTTAVAKLDATTTDPEVGRATREATARLLDAIKVELTGGDPRDDDPPPADPEPPRPLGPAPSA